MVTFIDENGVALPDAVGWDVQVQLQGRSGLPEDRYVNTWHFAAPGGALSYDAGVPQILGKLNSFYQALQNHLSTVALLPGSSFAFLRSYNGDDPEPRQSTEEEMSINLDTGPPQGSPNELAACLSFYNRRNIPQRRGRIFFGPMRAAGEIDIVRGDNKITAAFQTTMSNAATALKGDVAPFWCVKHRQAGGVTLPIPQYLQVTAGWVDDAFDIQRRRGAGAQSRTTW